MKKTFMERVASFIVDRRYLFIVLFIAMCIFSIFTANSVHVDEDLTDYLPDEAETRQGLQIMDDEFITYGTARVMVSNVTYEQAEEIAEMLRDIDGVRGVTLERDAAHYVGASALFDVVFDGEKLEDVSVRGVENIRNALRSYDTYIYTEVGNPTGIILEKEMRMVLVILIIIIILVLLLTSKTYA